MKKMIAALVLATAMLATGCTDAATAGLFAIGSQHRVQLYSGGKLVGEWTSTGAVKNENQSDGYFFKDQASGKLICVTGTIVITQE